MATASYRYSTDRAFRRDRYSTETLFFGPPQNRRCHISPSRLVVCEVGRDQKWTMCAANRCGGRSVYDLMGCPRCPGGQLCAVANVHVAGEAFLIASRLRAPSNTACAAQLRQAE